MNRLPPANLSWNRFMMTIRLLKIIFKNSMIKPTRKKNRNRWKASYGIPNTVWKSLKRKAKSHRIQNSKNTISA